MTWHATQVTDCPMVFINRFGRGKPFGWKRVMMNKF